MNSGFVLTGVALFGLGTLWGAGAFLAPKRASLRGGRLWGLAGFLWLSGLLAARFLAGEKPVIANLEGTLWSLAWLIAGSALLLSRSSGLPALLPFALPVVGLLLAASLFAGGALDKAWEAGGAMMVLHGGAALLGYAAFATSFVTGLMYLAQERLLRNKGSWAALEMLPDLSTLDHWNSLASAWGFPFLTLAAATGLARAPGLWGARWFAEPIVIGVFAPWLLYGVLLVGRFGMRLQGRRVALLAVAAFLTSLAGLGAGLFLGGHH